MPTDEARLVHGIADMAPTTPSEVDSSLYCFFCGAFEHEPHREECLWVLARSILMLPVPAVVWEPFTG